MFAIKFQHGLAAANFLLLGALVLTNARAATEPAAAEIVRARLIELVNENGEMRAQLHLDENGGGELRLRSPEGEIRVKLGATNDGAILLMLDRATEPGARLATDRSGPSLRLIDAARASASSRRNAISLQAESEMPTFPLPASPGHGICGG